MQKNRHSSVKKILVFGALVLGLQLIVSSIHAQTELTSPSYRIVDSTVDSGGGLTESASYSIIESIGNTVGDARLTSGTYALSSGQTSGFIASVPLINCFETTTNSSDTNCNNFPNNNGAVGECGSPGCYDRAKIEIDPQNNPIDTLYLITIEDITNSLTYYLQSDLSIASTYDANDYMTLCNLEGIDPRTGSGCANSADPDWNETLQSYNIYGLSTNTQYNVSARALQGDFTESAESPSVTTTTSQPALSFDLDIGANSSVETTPPYTIDFGEPVANVVTTSNNVIWLDVNTNITQGLNVVVRDTNNGLSNGSYTIVSTSEDLSIDPDNNGGFGLKLASISNTTLGPLNSGSVFDTAGIDEVGALSTISTLIAETNNIGNNQGQLSGGRIGLEAKVLTTTVTPGGIFTDQLIFTLIPNV